jgi:hypothetical protein
MRVEIVYALPDRYELVELELSSGSTVGEALKASGIAERHPGIDLSNLGIFGRRVALEAPLAEGDRVEIYRPLALDPKEARRVRAKRRRLGR